jgi:hypothetical protein
MSRTGWTVVALVVALGLGLSGASCLISYDPSGVDLIEPTDTSPRLFVIQPTPDEQVTTSLHVEVEIRNFTLVPKWGQANVDGEAHLVVLVDGEPIHAADQGIVDTSFDVDVSGLVQADATTHELEIQVANNDRTQYDSIRPIIVEFIVAGTGGGGDGTGTGSGAGLP